MNKTCQQSVPANSIFSCTTEESKMSTAECSSSTCATAPSCLLKVDDILKEYNSIDCVCCKQRFLINNFLKAEKKVVNKDTSGKGPNRQRETK